MPLVHSVLLLDVNFNSLRMESDKYKHGSIAGALQLSSNNTAQALYLKMLGVIAVHTTTTVCIYIATFHSF